MNKENIKKISTFGFFAMTASMVMTVYEYPVFAQSGFATLFYAIVAGVFWFIPVALISAEFASVKLWPKEGIFSWVSKTLGNRLGFLAIFFQWFQITVGFITMIFFIVGALSFVLGKPEMISNPMLYFLSVIVIFWIITISQFLGTKVTTKIAKVGLVGGILIPVSILFAMGILFIIQGNPLQIEFNISTLIPDFSKVNTLVVFSGFILAFMGIEASAAHIDEISNPKKTFPLVMISIAILTITFDSLGGIIIASVLPPDQIGANIGVIDSLQYLFKYTFDTFGVANADNVALLTTKVFALVIALGVVAEISAWVVGPSKGMFLAAKRGYLPKLFSKTNRFDVPTNFIIFQGFLATAWAAVLVFGTSGSGNMSFLLAIGLTVILYLIAYILFFIAYIVLITKHKDLERTYQVPFKKIGKWIFAMSGLVLSIGALLISFVPPSSLHSSQKSIYLILIVVSVAVSVALPLLIYEFYSKKEIKKISELENNKK